MSDELKYIISKLYGLKPRELLDLKKKIDEVFNEETDLIDVNDELSEIKERLERLERKYKRVEDLADTYEARMKQMGHVSKWWGGF